MTDSRQELQTLAASALMVGLHQAIEAYHEAVRGAKAGEHSRVSANAPCSRRWRRQRTHRGHLVRSVPDPPARSRREASSAPMPSAQPDVAEASHRRSVGRQRDHCTPTPPGRWRSQRARHPASPLPAPSSSAWVLHTGAPRPDIGQQRRHRSRRYNSLPPTRSNPPAACPRVVRSCMSACGAAYRQTSARMRSTAASDVATYDPPVAICDSLRRKSTRGGRWSFPEQSAESTTGWREPPAPVDTAPYRRDELEDMRARHLPRP